MLLEGPSIDVQNQTHNVPAAVMIAQHIMFNSVQHKRREHVELALLLSFAVMCTAAYMAMPRQKPPVGVTLDTCTKMQSLRYVYSYETRQVRSIKYGSWRILKHATMPTPSCTPAKSAISLLHSTSAI